MTLHKIRQKNQDYAKYFMISYREVQENQEYSGQTTKVNCTTFYVIDINLTLTFDRQKYVTWLILEWVIIVNAMKIILYFLEKSTLSSWSMKPVPVTLCPLRTRRIYHCRSDCYYKFNKIIRTILRHCVSIVCPFSISNQLSTYYLICLIFFTVLYLLFFISSLLFALYLLTFLSPFPTCIG